ncbi:hypothetical protein M409DRAFT_21912 [Zasmidium cellare ATCC 36951]|uniref:Zn(2)-C6 fungal-type domain-containing protein n=1 Tax=Zasmidium cellare ATCC 36951 TaxID=1080233 RepID=A0A6A6CL43_ZASCE|nr:uncharacterized protein M409DRAFT_21912 [Zasmidium cellare ATCC 36951]KAF2167761.1 hypothetical protein M409DRAFT_21912 [Zasmidium cellare ATCC 36951]
MAPSQGRGKPRTYHTKSRGGCITCKKRHIKCDQKRPACTNCTTRRLHCPFQDTAVVRTSTSPSDHKSPALVPSPSAIESNGNDASPTIPQGATDICLIQLDLYNHFAFHVCPTFTGQARHDESYRNLMIKTAFKYHFVLHEMLGLAALSKHLSCPNETYKALAASFQEKAIAGLDDILTKVDSENCVAVITFAHLIGVHSFCDTFSMGPNVTFSDFLEALIGSAQLLRGINAVVRPFWSDLAATEVGEFMKDAIARRDSYADRPGDETASLLMLIQNADISESSRQTYGDTIVWLQRCFDEVRALEPEHRATTNTAFVWLIMSSPAYLQLLDEARPEALVILANFAVVLHYRRDCWAIGNSGYTLLRSIMSHLGRQWKQWLVWPQSQIGIDHVDVAITP